MIGFESASTLAMTGSSTSSGNRARTRDTLSRTSAAAESGLRDSLKRTLIWLRSDRLCDVISSTPSMPDSESSRIFVTCDSTTSADAPRYVVLTLTTGSSMRGYSRTDRRWYEIRPSSRMTSDRTVANTGRFTQSSGRVIRSPRAARRPCVRTSARGAPAPRWRATRVRPTSARAAAPAPVRATPRRPATCSPERPPCAPARRRAA